MKHIYVLRIGCKLLVKSINYVNFFSGFCNVQGNLYKGQRWNTAQAYLRPAMERSNLDISINSNVKKVKSLHLM